VDVGVGVSCACANTGTKADAIITNANFIGPSYAL
jgi:hypothetical protein